MRFTFASIAWTLLDPSGASVGANAIIIVLDPPTAGTINIKLVRNRDHRRRRFVFVSAAIIADAVVGSTAPEIRIRAPLVNSISTTLPADGGGNAGIAGAVGSDGAGAIVTAENVGAFSPARCDTRHSSCRHRNSWLV